MALAAPWLSLAWLLAKGGDIVPIPGTRRPDHVEDNVGAVNVSLSPSDVADLEVAVDRLPVTGARYTKGSMAKDNLAKESMTRESLKHVSS